MTHREHPQATDSGREVDGWSVEYIEETESTQTDLLARAAAGTLVHRTALAAGYQQRGRGRLDRTWEAPPDTNLLVSLGFEDVPDDPGLLMRRVAVALVDVLAHVGVLHAALKWPNDVEVDGRKLAGLLAQRAASGAVVVGIGLNVGWAPTGATSVSDELGSASVPTPDEILQTLLAHYDRLEVMDDDALATRYAEHLGTIGQQVRVQMADRVVVGTAVAVDPRGQLTVRGIDGRDEIIASGDVVHLRRTPDSTG